MTRQPFPFNPHPLDPAALQRLRQDLDGLDVVEGGALLDELSRDQHQFSPPLERALHDCRAQLVVRAHDREQLRRVAALCHRHRAPLTLRGAGTGNHGQCVPLQGGVVLDTSPLQRLLDLDPETGVLCAEPGCRLLELDRQLQPHGRALRLAPSTWRTATLGGYIAGGSSGVGSLRWGLLRDRGNLLGLEVLTVEAEPRWLQLEAEAAAALNHAYGCNGILTAITVPTAPWQPWQELVLELSDRPAALGLAADLTAAALELDQLAYLEPSLAALMPSLAGLPPPTGDRLLLHATPAAVGPITAATRGRGGQVLLQRPCWPPRGLLLRELCWNHTTLQARAADPGLTYLIVMLPDPVEPVLAALAAAEPGLLWHLERVRQGGCPRWVGLPVFPWRGEAALADLIARCRALGVLVFNPHAITVEDSGLGVVDAGQVAAKHAHDPLGLLNPGKLRGWTESEG